jgi:cholest-4-en-3-one 26-monooxygenase
MSQCPYSNLLDPDTYSQGMPYQKLSDMRKESGPVIKMDDPITGVPYWAILGREEMDFVSKKPQLFSSAEKTGFPMEFPQDLIEAIFRLQIINMDPPDHVKYRKIVRRAFTINAVNSYQAKFEEHARRIVDAVASRGECEFVEEVAAELPLLAILELLGIPLKDRKEFFDWTNTMIFADDPDMMTGEEEGMLASLQVLEYAKKLAAEHRVSSKAERNIVLASLLDSEVAGESLTEDEFCWFFILLLVGGNESTRTVMAQGMRLLMEHPDQLQYLIDNPDKIEGAVEEILRYNTAFCMMRRTAMEDVEVGGQMIKKGDKVILHYHAVGLDEKVFGDDALSFDVTRAERMPDLYNQHRAFGIGQHFCLGTHLARQELNIMFNEFLPRLKNPKFAEPPKFVRSYFVNAMKEMKITFDKEAS